MDIEHKIKQTLKKQYEFFESKITYSYDFRIEQLKKLKTKIIQLEDKINNALEDDLGKSEFEAYTTEIGFVLYNLTHTIKNLKQWMKPKKVKTSILIQPSSSKIHYTPLGTNLIISPFNYPFGLTFAPLISALSAGNTVVIKTSELTPNVSKVIQDLLKDLFVCEYVAYIDGGIEETKCLLKQKFSHIFFTGSPKVGSIVMRYASKYLTPVTLELGGKSPCIVHSDANIDIAVNRIVYGKFINLGQTCIAPDYVLVHKKIKDQFIQKIKSRIIKLYGVDPSVSSALGKIINNKHHDRLTNLIINDKVVIGGEFDKSTKFIAPTIMSDVTLDDDVMKEEIFGPILPILQYEHLSEVFDTINKLPQSPLACYVFSQDKKIQDEIMTKVQFGGGCINHCLQHYLNTNLPFGGLGQSGIGNYHGFSGFECFSHKKSILKAPTWIDLPFIYPPYNWKLKFIRLLMR